MDPNQHTAEPEGNCEEKSEETSTEVETSEEIKADKRRRKCPPMPRPFSAGEK